MTCIEYRAQFEISLNERKSFESGKDHLLICSACRQYTESMKSVVEQLQNIPQVDIPKDILDRIRSIPEIDKALETNLSWRKDILRAMTYILAGTVIYLLSSLTSPVICLIVTNLLMFISIIIVAINFLKRPVLGYN